MQFTHNNPSEHVYWEHFIALPVHPKLCCCFIKSLNSCQTKDLRKTVTPDLSHVIDLNKEQILV